MKHHSPLGTPFPQTGLCRLLGFLISLSSLSAAPPPNLQVSIIHSFPSSGPDARNPQHPLRAGPDGLLYGVTPAGGHLNQGVLFQIRTNGTEYRILHQFTKRPGDGGGPVGQLWYSPKRILYGVTESGGAPYGTVYAYHLESATFRILHSFSGVNDAQYPSAGLLLGTDGRLFGVSDQGGTDQQGTLFFLNVDGSSPGLLHHFKGALGDGGHPQAPLLETRDGFLYGTSSTGGNFGLGTIFRIRKEGTDYRVLHHFAGAPNDAGIPMAPLVEDGFGALFGVGRGGGSTGQGGAVFRIQSDGSNYQLLQKFSGLNDAPRLPGNGLAITPGGWILGVTMSGGQRQMGTVFVMSKDGATMRVIHHFTGHGNLDGAHPVARLIRAGESYYGTTEKGGAHNGGAIYRISLSR